MQRSSTIIMGGSTTKTQVQQFSQVNQMTGGNQRIIKPAVLESRDGSISIQNGIREVISVSIGTDNGANNQSNSYVKITSSESNSWPRIFGNEYQIFVTDPDKFTYGFIIVGGGRYTYKGQGKLWDNDRQILAEEDDLNLSTPGFIVVKAFKSNVNVNLTGGANHTYNINPLQFVRFNRAEGTHVLKFFDSKGSERRYLLNTGRSYYIYNSGTCIDKDSNVVLPLYSEDQNAIATYDDDSLNSLLVSSGCMISINQFSSQTSSSKHFQYSHSSSSSSFAHSSSNFSSDVYQSSSHYQSSSSQYRNSSGGVYIESGFGYNNNVLFL